MGWAFAGERHAYFQPLPGVPGAHQVTHCLLPPTPQGIGGLPLPCPSCCLILPCKGSNRLQCSTLVLPPAIHFTSYTGIPGVGCPITWYSSLSHLSCILCLPFQAVFLTRTRFPMPNAAPLHLMSYSPLCLACCLLATCLAFLMFYSWTC